MFGYLNTGNPRYIGETEAQEIKNASIEKGYLEYADYDTNALNNVRLTLPNGRIVVVNLNTVFGQVMWKTSETGTLYQIGLDKPSQIVIDNTTDPFTTTSRLPTPSVVAYASNPYPPGDYDYAITIYDPDTGEESRPITATFTVGVNQVVRHANFPAVNDLFPDRPNLQWRIYRRPYGGSEYLLVNGATTISANSLYAGPYNDIIADADLGIPCDSLDNYVDFLRSPAVAGVALFNDHLFVFGSRNTYSRINFSKQGEWWAFPLENEINLPGRWRGACVLNESLVLFSSEGVFVLYGDNADNFALKQIDLDLTDNDDIGVMPRSARAVGGIALFGITKDITFQGEAGTGVVQIMAFDGAKAKSISEKIKDLFPFGDNSATENMETSIIDNRFYAIRMIDLDATHANIIAAGRTMATATSADIVYQTLVFDTYLMGWLTADDNGVFTYRTKEFALPRQVQFHKRIWVECEGDCTLQFMGDGQVVSELAISHAAKMKRYYNIKSRRYDAFSFRFTGSSGCKIYDFGVDE
jgi:hypothetical protein